MSDYFFQSDYASDLWRWSKIYETVKNQKNIGKSNFQLDQIQKEIIKSRDAALAFFFALFIGYKTDIMQELIIETKNSKYAYAFASSILGSDVDRLQEIVIASKNIKYICQFGCNVNGADLKRIERLIIKSANQKYANMWIKNVKGCDIGKLKRIILNAKDIKPKYIYELAVNLTSKRDINRAEDLIIKSGIPRYIRLFAKNIKLANIRRLEDAILKTNNSKEIREFANIKGTRLNNFSLLF